MYRPYVLESATVQILSTNSDLDISFFFSFRGSNQLPVQEMLFSIF